MSQPLHKALPYLLALSLLFCYNIACCQLRNTVISTDSLRKADLPKSKKDDFDLFQKLDAEIDSKAALEQTRQKMLLLKQQAIKSHDDIMLARSLYELMKINDLRTEDTLYFKNSAFMDTLLTDPHSSFTLKAIIYVLQAQRLNSFTYRYLKFNRAAYRSKNIPVDYASLSNEELDSIWTKDLDAALSSHPALGDSKKVLWLSSSPDVFLFNPAFGDIVLSEYVNQSAYENYNSINYRNKAALWPSLSSSEFRKKLDSIAKNSKDLNTLTGYHRWLLFNRNNNTTSAFVESLVRKYIFSFTSSDSLSYQSYIRYLKTQTASPFAAVKAHSIYQLCLIWNEAGNQYFNNPDGYAYITGGIFNKKNQYLPDSALQLFEENKALLNNYPAFNDILSLMAEEIQARGLSIAMDNKFVPNENIPLRVLYKNADTLYYRVIPIISGEQSGTPNIKVTREMMNRKPVASGVFALPMPPDHNKHAVYLKLAALPVGHYRLLFNYAELKTGDSSFYNIPFQVTSISAINSDERIYVLDRKTGTPLAGATIEAFKKGENVVAKVPASVRKEGYFTMPDDVADSVNIAFKGDTLGYSFVIHDNARNDNSNENIYDKDEYDDLVDFYDDKLTMDIFTDRSIYRPGQTVHYKIILLTRNPKTGEPMLFNSKNLGGIFKNRMSAWLKKNHATITLSDPFNHNVDSARMAPNEYGSFAGSFILPKTAATGEWNIDGKPDRDNQNKGDFRVEEYKRPAIELSMEKPKKMLKPGEPFTIILKLRSFSGGELGNIPITYTINRSGVLPSKTIKPDYNNYVQGKISDTIGYTNEKGELVIPVNDTLLAKYKWGDDDVDDYNYAIGASATDATGETTSINENLTISSRPIKISISRNMIYDRQSLPALAVNTTADFEGTVGRKVAVKVYAVNDPEQTGLKFKNTDQWYYPETERNKWFPALAVIPPVVPKRTLVLDTIINTALYEKLVLPKEKFSTGFYELVAETRGDDHIIDGQSNYKFKVFDSQSGTIPGDDLDYMPVTTAKPGEAITWYNYNKTNAYTIYQVLYQAGEKKAVRNIYNEVPEQPGLQRWTYHIPSNATGNLIFTRVYVSNNQVIKNSKTVYLIVPENVQPEIIIEKYRKVMAPGAEETFTLSVKTKNENTAAELMTTLYDASLDKLKEHEWYLPNQREYHPSLYAQWPYRLYLQQQAGNFSESERRVMMREIGYARRLNFEEDLEGKVAGLAVTNSQGLGEVVVVGYGTKRAYATGSLTTVMIRGRSNLADYKQPLIILNGEIYTAGLDKLNSSAITQALVLKGAEASALYGSSAANGVLIISTKGPIVLPEAPEPIVKIRKNFNETAFFFPQVHAGNDGYYSFSFTMPESATEWNWKVLAHTKKAQFTFLERKLQTQSNLMVQPNMPRLLYQGDKLKLESRITNLDTTNATGKITCKIEDAVTGDNITSTLLTNNQLPFSIGKKSSGAASFALNVPEQQLNPLKIIITASTAGAADAEEHIIPVLSSKILIRQSVRVKFDQQSVLTIPIIKLPADAVLFGIRVSIAQKPQAALVNALPWLANYSYDCAEQIFNKLNALATGLRLMQKDTLAQRMFAQASNNIEKEKPKESPLPDEMAAEATPWLSLSSQTATQHQQLLKVLDTVASKNNIAQYLQRIYKLQQTDGGLAWFDGGKSSEYISAYVLAGFGRLKQQGWKPGTGDNVRFQQFINELYKYNVAQVLNSRISDYDAYQVYALSYWITEQGATKALTQHVNLLLDTAWKNPDMSSLQEQALLIINTFSYNTTGSILYEKAQQQLASISELAINDEQNGLRWKDISDAEDLNTSSEETMALLAEAFRLSTKYPKVNSGMVKWLLTTRGDQHWQTTKATAAAIDMLQKEKGSAVGENRSFSADISGQHLAVSDDLLTGVPSAFVPARQLPAVITLQQQVTNTSGALTWYYFAKPASLDTINKAIHIGKQFYSYDKNKGWVAFTNNTHLHIGDKVRVKLTIETASRLKFVHISDPRAAAFEPADNNSGYQYSDGLSYYLSVKDAGLEIFTESVPRGISEIDYEMIVAMDGQFSSGPAQLQCMYQPSVTAYSSPEIIITN